MASSEAQDTGFPMALNVTGCLLYVQMIGIWCLTVWQQLGSPSKMRLVELGPGRGTLMADLLRGTAPFKPFTAGLDIHLVEVRHSICDPGHRPTPSLTVMHSLSISLQHSSRHRCSFATSAYPQGGRGTSRNMKHYIPDLWKAHHCSVHEVRGGQQQQHH